MAQQVSYNGVNIDLARVSYSGRSLYDDRDMVSGSYVISFNVQGIVYSTSNSQTGPAGFVVNRNSIEALLTQPQKEFKWTINSATQWDIIGSGTPTTTQKLDRRWGPKPRSVQISEIAGGQACKVSFVLEATISSCSSPSDIEEFYWQFAYAYDRNFTCSRTITGKIRIQSGAVNPNVASTSIASIALTDTNQDWFPTCPFGFYRDSQNYTLSPDGLTMSWTIVDKQVWRTLPAPLSDGSATMNIDQSGGILTKTLTGSFSAPMDTPKQVVAEFVIALIQARFPLLFVTGGGTPSTTTGSEFIRRFSITNHEFENKMDFSITTQVSADPFIQKNASGNSTPYPIEGGNSVFSKYFGDVQSVPPATGDSWTSSNGIQTIRGMAGTAELVPVPAGPFATCTSTPFTPGTDNSGNDPAGTSLPNANTGSPDTQPGGSFPAPNYPGNTSTWHDQFPYITFVDCYQYIQDYNNVILQAASNDFSFSNTTTYTLTVPETVQQTARPKMIVIQTGMARRMGAMPEIPDFYSPFGGNGILLRNEAKPLAPEFLADGQTLIYKCTWTKTYYLPGAWGMEGTMGEDGTTPISATAPNIQIDRPLSKQVNEADTDMSVKSKRWLDFENPQTDNTGSEGPISGNYNTDYPAAT